MELLDIKLPTIRRLQFANLESKQVWENKINIAKRATKQIEFQSLKYGLRDCILWEVDPMMLENTLKSLSRQNFVALPIEKNYKNELVNKDINFTYTILISNSISNSESFIHAKEKNDFSTLSKLLNIPEHCLKFEEDNKVYSIDLMWKQSENSINTELKKTKRKFIENDLEKNLIRLKFGDEQYKIFSTFEKLGIRLITYKSLNFNDKESIRIANEIIDFAKSIKLNGIDEILDILKLPFEWDCYKGIATINTPVFKFVSNSLPCYPAYIVQRESDYYPKEAPFGIKFPWKFPWEHKK